MALCSNGDAKEIEGSAATRSFGARGLVSLPAVWNPSPLPEGSNQNLRMDVKMKFIPWVRLKNVYLWHLSSLPDIKESVMRGRFGENLREMVSSFEVCSPWTLDDTSIYAPAWRETTRLVRSQRSLHDAAGAI
jgi:hypothetical protein